MSGLPDRGRGPGDLIRQLASAYASYRLFPGDPSQPAFQAAVERVAQAARAALAAGPVSADIRSARFLIADEELRPDATVERLGLACFDRRIEQLHVHTVPSVDDVAGFAHLLVLPIDEVADRGGAGSVLQALGVTAITVGEVADDEDDDSADLEGLTPEQLLLWERLQDPAGLAASLLVEGLPGEPPAAAHDLYVRFRAIEEILPSRLTARRDFFVRVRQVFDHLPVAIGREFHAIVLTRLASERFAMSFGVSLTDQELVDVLFDLADYGGPDPRDLGRRVAAMTDRKGAILELIESRHEASGEALSDLAANDEATLVALNLAAGDETVRMAVADALAAQLVDVASEDAVVLRDLFPASDDDRRTLALLALRDYLAAEDRRVSVERVLSAWAERVRSALRAGDASLTHRLLELVDAAIPADAEVFKRDAGVRARASVPTPTLVRDLLARRSAGAGAEALVGPLEPFTPWSLHAVLDVLAEEQEAGVRSVLIAVAGSLSRGHVDVLAERIDDERWFVVRNLATILGRVPDAGDEALPTLARLARHPEGAVRREVVRSLVAISGAGAVPYLRRLAVDEDAHVSHAARQALTSVHADVAARALADLAREGRTTDERRAALDALASHPSPEVPALLGGLASRRSDQPLPAPLRRHARRLERSGREVRS